MKILPLLLIVIGTVAQAQAPSATAIPAPAGHVTGTVWCQDTGRPGRFASIQLVAEQTFAAPRIDPAAGNPGADPTKLKIDALASTLTSAIKNIFSGSDLSTLTGLDGRFQLDKVPPGTYYVVAQLQGYISPLSSLSLDERMEPNADTLASIVSRVQKIVVVPGQALNLRVELNRGATLSGSITYSDGSPAQSVAPQLLLRAKDGSWKPLMLGSPLPSTTDDHGMFRFYGLAPGQYAVKAALPTEQSIIGIGLGQMSTHRASGDALVLYSGGVSRDSEIKPIELAGNDHRTGVNIAFPLDGLHTLSGSVVAESDRHPVNAGIIVLQDPDTKAALRTVLIGQDGTFVLHYVPDGAYVLKVTSAGDMQKGPDGLTCPLRCKQTTSYGSTALAVTVKNDLSGVVLQVPGDPQH